MSKKLLSVYLSLVLVLSSAFGVFGISVLADDEYAPIVEEGKGQKTDTEESNEEANTSNTDSSEVKEEISTDQEDSSKTKEDL